MTIVGKKIIDAGIGGSSGTDIFSYRDAAQYVLAPDSFTESTPASNPPPVPISSMWAENASAISKPNTTSTPVKRISGNLLLLKAIFGLRAANHDGLLDNAKKLEIALTVIEKALGKRLADGEWPAESSEEALLKIENALVRAETAVKVKIRRELAKFVSPQDIFMKTADGDFPRRPVDLNGRRIFYLDAVNSLSVQLDGAAFIERVRHVLDCARATSLTAAIDNTAAFVRAELGGASHLKGNALDKQETIGATDETELRWGIISGRTDPDYKNFDAGSIMASLGRQLEMLSKAKKAVSSGDLGRATEIFTSVVSNSDFKKIPERIAAHESADALIEFKASVATVIAAAAVSEIAAGLAAPYIKGAFATTRGGAALRELARLFVSSSSFVTAHGAISIPLTGEIPYDFEKGAFENLGEYGKEIAYTMAMFKMIGATASVTRGFVTGGFSAVASFPLEAAAFQTFGYAREVAEKSLYGADTDPEMMFTPGPVMEGAKFLLALKVGRFVAAPRTRASEIKPARAKAGKRPAARRPARDPESGMAEVPNGSGVGLLRKLRGVLRGDDGSPELELSRRTRRRFSADAADLLDRIVGGLGGRSGNFPELRETLHETLEEGPESAMGALRILANATDVAVLIPEAERTPSNFARSHRKDPRLAAVVSELAAEAKWEAGAASPLIPEIDALAERARSGEFRPAQAAPLAPPILPSSAQVVSLQVAKAEPAAAATLLCPASAPAPVVAPATVPALAPTPSSGTFKPPPLYVPPVVSASLVPEGLSMVSETFKPGDRRQIAINSEGNAVVDIYSQDTVVYVDPSETPGEWRITRRRSLFYVNFPVGFKAAGEEVWRDDIADRRTLVPGDVIEVKGRRFRFDVVREDRSPTIGPPAGTPLEGRTVEFLCFVDDALVTEELDASALKRAETIEIGRNEGDLQFPGRREVSRRHATLHRDASQGTWFVEDHSRFGTFVQRNGEGKWERVPAEGTEVLHGDRIRLGPDGQEIAFSVKKKSKDR